MTRPFRPPVLGDETIASLIAELKPLPPDWRNRLRPRTRQARHRRARLECVGRHGTLYELQTRQHVHYPANFSVVLVYRAPQGDSYRLLRCNGLHPAGHRNLLERTEFGTTFHVHRATRRYQEAGLDIDGYAEPDRTFSTLDQALTRMAELANLETGPEPVELF